MFGLAVLILIFGPVSGAHFNPVVSAVDWLLGRRARHRPGWSVTCSPTPRPRSSAASPGRVLANVMFDLPAVQISTKDRVSVGHGLGEVVATAGLILLIFALARTGRAALSAAAVGAYIGAAYWFTSSTSFANPAVTVGRMFSDTFAGIAPGSVPLFIAAQLVGAAVGLGAGAAAVPRRRGRRRPRRRPPCQHPSPTERGAEPMSKPSVLFVCVHNAGRSQMAAAFLTHLSQGAVEVRSAGSAPGRPDQPGRRPGHGGGRASTSPPRRPRSSPTRPSASPTW